MSLNTIIAVCGKGGVGKTSISALLTKVLADKHKVLAIDADPAVGLSIALGIKIKKTVDDIRNEIIQQIKECSKVERRDLIEKIDYEMFAAIEEKKNLAFLAIGRPENEGCYCQINIFLKEIINDISDNFEYVIIDGEAGIEQINRRVMEKVTHLIIVTDTSLKGFNAAESIFKVAKKTIKFLKAGLIINRIKKDENYKINLNDISLPVIGNINEDIKIYNADRTGMNFLELNECNAMNSINNVIDDFVS